MKVASDSESEPGKVSDPEDGMMSLVPPVTDIS